jgi:uncharacterized protein YndB with AHSA1/START domain
MKLKIFLSLLGVLVLFLFYVSTREGKFNYSVTMPVNAPVEKVFPYLSDLKLGSQWSPFEKVDPDMKKEYVGNKLIFDGNSKAGSGSVEILKIVPNESVELKLIMTKPFNAENLITYKVVPTQTGVDFTWSMSGDGGYMGKLMSVFIDCEKMITDQFRTGINNLKQIVEK